MAATGDLASPQATLRAITYRLTSTPTKQLPWIAGQLAGHLWSCKDLLSSPATHKNQGNEAAVSVNRLRTHLSTLLQDRTVEGRWAAVVLVKATVEAGGIEAVSKSNVWVRSLLGILKKPDPPTTRILALTILTRIFTLTWDHTNLIREVTTPALPAFIGTCLSNAESHRCSGHELRTILEAFATLIPRHPTMFRTHEAQIRVVMLRILSSTPSTTGSGRHYSSEQKDIAERLLFLVHHCSPKQGAADKWDEALKATIAAAHSTCDRVFRCVIEDWQSTSGVHPSLAGNALFQGEPKMEADDSAGLSGWKGIFAGSERLVSLLDLMSAQINTATAGAVTVRLGLITDLLTRSFHVRTPSTKHINLKPNQQISKNERECFFVVLPRVHVAALAMTQSILRRFGNAAASMVQPMLALVTWLFEAEAHDAGVRTATYRLLSDMLELNGPGLAREDVADIESIIKACCHELLPMDQYPTVNGMASTQHAQAAISMQTETAASNNAATQKATQDAAGAVLPLCLSKLVATHIPGQLRTLMERTAVVTRHKEALVASVLNPASSTSRSKMESSLLPLLARQYAHSSEVEALLRPRMPVIRTGPSGSGEEEADEYDQGDHPVSVADEHMNTTRSVDEDDEPTAGLLNALGAQDGAVDSEDLYSTSPNRPMGPSQTEEVHEKRRAHDDDARNQRSTKRLRASPTSDTVVPDAAHMGTDPEREAAQSGVALTLAHGQPPSSFVTAPAPSQQAVKTPTAPQSEAVTSFKEGDTVDVGSDESDFEMPPLTMEPDTEDEESDDGNEE